MTYPPGADRCPDPPLRRAVGPLASALVLLTVTSGCFANPTPEDDARATESSQAAASPSPRAFTPNSWWNTPVPDDAPEHPRSGQILRYMQTAPEAGDGCVRLAGTQNAWGQPVYWAEPGDPEYDIEIEIPDDIPELESVRIPRGAAAADNNDGSMTIFDPERGYAVAFTNAEFDSAAEQWSAAGATVTYLDSNGLHADTGQSSDERNLGSHRGNNAAVMMARYDEVQAGRIEHVLKVASGPEASRRFVFPMVGSDGDSNRRDAPPQGLRFRIRPSVDLESLDLDPQTLVIATALQDYGFYIGDSGSVTALKLEDTHTSRGEKVWNMPATALCELPLTTEFWEVLPEGYRPSPG